MIEDVTMADPEGSLVSRRSRRSTAGNRMEAALAEMAIDTTEKDVEDDIEFVNDKDEEDVFESDFESTDEEAEKEDEEAGDKAVQDEEKKARKTARSKLDKVTAAAHAKHKATFDPQSAQATATTSKSKEIHRRVSLGVAVNAETGEVVRPSKESPARKKRHSQRKHTILSTSAHVKRMKRSEEKKAAAPRKVRIESKFYTQAELIARALDNEEGNLVEHRDYLKIEEEKRKRARVVRATINGPLLRWISKGEEVKIVVPPPPLPPPVPAYPNFSRPAGQAFYYASYTTASGSIPYGQGSGAFPYAMGPQGVQIPAGAYGGALNYTPTVPTPHPASSTATSTPAVSGSTTPTFTATTSASPTVTVPNVSTSMQASTSQSLPASSQQTPSQPLFQPTNYIHYSHQVTEATTTSTGAMPPPAAPAAPQPEPQPTERIEKMTRNYVVHELSQHEGVPMPQWTETMTAMFGGSVKWDEVKVYVGKNRPLSRPKQTCPVTGRYAKYRDPRTGVPFSDVRAYEVLTAILKHEYVWSPGLRCYVRKEVREVEEEGAEAMAA